MVRSLHRGLLHGGLLLIALLYMATPGELYAQGGIRAGIQAGLSLAGLGGRDAGSVERRAGATLGAFATIPTGDRLEVQPELAYTQKGARYAGATDALSYLEVAGLLRYSSDLKHPGIPARTYLMAGPSAGMLLGAEVVGVDVTDLYRTMDFGAVFGGGLQIDRFYLSARYQQGLGSIMKPIGQIEQDYRNRTISILVGVLIF